MEVSIVNDDSIFIKKLSQDDFDSIFDHYGGQLANSGLYMSDFWEVKDRYYPVKIVDRQGNLIYKLGEYGTPNWCDLPSSGEETVSFVIEDNQEAIMGLVAFAGWYHPNNVYWFKINGQLVCEFWYD